MRLKDDNQGIVKEIEFKFSQWSATNGHIPRSEEPRQQAAQVQGEQVQQGRQAPGNYNLKAKNRYIF